MLDLATTIKMPSKLIQIHFPDEWGFQLHTNFSLFLRWKFQPSKLIKPVSTVELFEVMHKTKVSLYNLLFHNHCVCFSIYEIFNIIIHIFYFSGQPRSSLETKKNSITDDYTISQTVLGLGINGKGGLISEGVLISVRSSIRFEPFNFPALWNICCV